MVLGNLEGVGLVLVDLEGLGRFWWGWFGFDGVDLVLVDLVWLHHTILCT